LRFSGGRAARPRSLRPPKGLPDAKNLVLIIGLFAEVHRGQDDLAGLSYQLGYVSDPHRISVPVFNAGEEPSLSIRKLYDGIKFYDPDRFGSHSTRIGI
jgi:hypothetical protein